MKALAFLGGVIGIVGLQLSAAAITTNLYSTQFEAAQGYNSASNLVGQAGWVGDGTGGNGLVNDFIPGQGQQAYIGFNAPTPGDDLTFVWRPINFSPLTTGFPKVKFSTQIQFIDSANGNYDFFQWRAYNAQADRLFTLDFDVFFTNINYRLDGTNDYVASGVEFSFNTTYLLNVMMDFAANRWSATLNDAVIASNQPITTVNAPLNLGDMDAVWFLYDPEAPGDNYMVFDNYTVTAESVPVTPAQLQFLGRTAQGWALLQVAGSAGSRWAVEASTNLTQWTSLQTNQIAGTHFDVVDQSAAGLPRRYYRARHVP